MAPIPNPSPIGQMIEIIAGIIGVILAIYWLVQHLREDARDRRLGIPDYSVEEQAGVTFVRFWKPSPPAAIINYFTARGWTWKPADKTLFTTEDVSKQEIRRMMEEALTNPAPSQQGPVPDTP